jgi:hypothetical protein
MATPTAVAATYREQVLTGFDFYDPEVLNELAKRYEDQDLTFFHIWRSMGMRLAAKQDEVYHYEDERIHEVFHVKTNVGDPGAGNSVNITLSASDLDAGNRFYPRVGDQVLFANDVYGRIEAIDVTAPAAPVLTVEPNLNAENIGALTAGDTVIIVSSSFADGTDQPSPALRGVVKRTSVCQIIKEAVKVNGAELTRSSWFKKWDDGGNIIGYYTTALDDLTYRLALKISGAFEVGKLTDNAALVSADGEEIKTTKGIFPTITDLGNTIPYTPGTWTVTDYDEIDRILTREGCSAENIWAGMGLNFYQENENTMVDFLKDTSVNFTHVVNTMFGGNETLALSVGFKSLYKSNRNYMMNVMRHWSNPKYLGATGYDYNQRAIFIPLDKVKDSKDGSTSHRVMIRYRELGGYNRESELFSIAGAGGGTYVSSIDAKNDYARAHQGIQFRKANGLIQIKPV